MKNVFTLLTLGLLFFAGVQAQTPGNSSEDIKVFILDAGEKMEQALENKDVEEFGSFFAEDAMFKPAGKEPIEGRQAIIDTHKGFVAHGLKLNIDPDEVLAFGDYVSEIGSYEISSPDGQTVDKGYYSTLWKKSDGEWKIYRDIVSTSMK